MTTTTTTTASLTIGINCVHPVAQVNVTFDGTPTGFNVAMAALQSQGKAPQIRSQDLWQFFKGGLTRGEFNGFYADGTFVVIL